jgi:hypothetical protein
VPSQDGSRAIAPGSATRGARPYRIAPESRPPERRPPANRKSGDDGVEFSVANFMRLLSYRAQGQVQRGPKNLGHGHNSGPRLGTSPPGMAAGRNAQGPTRRSLSLRGITMEPCRGPFPGWILPIAISPRSSIGARAGKRPSRCHLTRRAGNGQNHKPEATSCWPRLPCRCRCCDCPP